MNEIVKALFDRKSVRVYEDKPIDSETKKLIYEAAIQAPSAGNMSLYTIIDITDQSIKDRMVNEFGYQPFVAQAPMVAIFCAEYARWYETFLKVEDEVREPGVGDLFLAMTDTIASAQNSVTAAEALGIGSCYIGSVLGNGEEYREMLGLPKYVTPVALVVYGYPTEQQKTRIKPSRHEVEDVVYENKYDLSKLENYATAIGKKHNLSGEAIETNLKGRCEKKWNGERRVNRSRSVEAMLKDWMKD